MNKRHYFFVFLIALVSIIIIGGYLFSSVIQNKIVDNLINQYGDNEAVTVVTLAHTLEQAVKSTQEKLTLVGSIPLVADGTTLECNNLLRYIASTTVTRIGNMGRVTTDGLFHCSLNPALIGVKANTLGKYIDDIFNDPEHLPVMSRAVKPPGSNSYVVAVHVPVWGPDKIFKGTLGGAMYLSDLKEKYLSPVNLPKNASVVVFDDDGTILFHFKSEFIGKNYGSPEYQALLVNAIPPDELIQQTKDGVSGKIRYSFQGVQRITAYGPVHVFPGRNWRIAVTIPISGAKDDIGALNIPQLFFILVLLIVILVIFSSILFVYFAIRYVFRPMESIDKAKTEFVSLASHQLRTPLSSVNWYTEMLLAGDAGKINDEQKKYLDEIYIGNQRMVALVNALLNVSRLELGTFSVEPVEMDVVETAHSVINELKPQIIERKLEVKETHKDITKIIADPKLMRIVLQNLLSNAVKYTPEKGIVTIDIKNIIKGDQISGQKVDLNGIVITVCDSGYGIPDGDKDKMFGKLFRAENVREMDTEGTGLGLYIVKSIIDHAGGKIWFESELNKGTTFYVFLPLEGMKKKEGSAKIE